MTYTLYDTPVLSFIILNEVLYIRPQNYSFEIWYFNSYNGTSNYTEPRYTVYGSKNLTNYLGSFHQRDHFDVIKSEDNEMTLFTSKNNFLLYHNMSNAMQIWFRIPELAAQNCFNSDNFHFIYPTQTTFHINQAASSKGDCNFYVFPALPSIESSSATLPTLCMTNIQYNSSKMLEVFSVILLNSAVNNTKLFECNQDSCKDWSNTCVNGNTLQFTIPPDGYLAIDYYSLDDSKKYPVTLDPEKHKCMTPVFAWFEFDIGFFKARSAYHYTTRLQPTLAANSL
uniref:Uncharacterized protein n=1 Tax=Acrobeloides nanus TaxID=290746 RepID=A0A914ELC0_9BILA